MQTIKLKMIKPSKQDDCLVIELCEKIICIKIINTVMYTYYIIGIDV